MAAERAVAASGADHDAPAVRRRNVPSNTTKDGNVNRVEIDEKKTQIKKVRFCNQLVKMAPGGTHHSRAAADMFNFYRMSKRSGNFLMNGSSLLHLSSSQS